MGWRSIRASWKAVVVAVLLGGSLHRPSTAPRPAEAADVIHLYDDLGRLVTAIDAAGNSASYRYDAAGNLLEISRSSPGGPAITGFVPSTGPYGTSVTISGTGFSAIPGENTVTFNGTAAIPSSSTATRLVTSVPVGAITGQITVTTPAGSAGSGAAFTVTVPDLVATGLTAPSAAATQQAISVSWTVANRGTAPGKPTWTDVVYLSRDINCCAGNDIVAAATTTQSLSPAQSYSRTQNVTLPRVPAGQYYLVLNADDGGTVSESNEGNNRRTLPITLTNSDLVPTALSVTGAAVIGQNITAAWTAANQGGGAAQGQWKDSLYLAPTPSCCDDATFLAGPIRLGPLNAGAAYSTIATVKVPEWAPGAYYLTVAVDALNNVYEGNEANNRRAIPITITAPDLVPTALTAPASATTQQPITVSWTVKNQGTAPVTSGSNDRLSLVSAVCCSSVVLTTASRPTSLAPGASYTQTKTLTVASVPTGDYFLVLDVDADHTLRESVETNNQRRVPIAINTPDLVAAGVIAPASGRAQQVISLSWTVANRGTGTAKAPWTDTVYLSTDRTCCATDALLASVSHLTPLSAGGSYSQAKSVTIPLRPPGNYFLILKVDATAALYEAAETNNEFAVPFTIAP